MAIYSFSESRRYVLSFVRSLLKRQSSTQKECYYPNGAKTGYSYSPCTNDTHSACCYPGTGDVCQPNGLCWWPGTATLYRAACTDPTWQSPNCPKACADVKNDTWIRTTPCDNEGHFGCDFNATCPNGTFYDYSILKTAPANQFPYLNTSTTSLNASSLPSATLSSETTSASAVKTTETATVFTMAGAPLSTSLPGTQSSVPTASASSSPALGTGVIAGIAIGGVAILAAAVAMGFILARRRKQGGKGKVEAGGEVAPPGYGEAMVKSQPYGGSDKMSQPAEVHAVSMVVELDGSGVNR